MKRHMVFSGVRKLTTGALLVLLLLLVLPSRALADSKYYTVKVDKGYLALRTAPAYDERNEIGELYTGDTVVLLSKYSNKYWWVYAPKYNRNGYVNKDYLSFLSASASTYGDYRVSVAKGYLALRTAPSYNEKNEIGELYTGDVVNVLDKSNGQYWWVYSYKYGKKGYVNKDYLVR